MKNVASTTIQPILEILEIMRQQNDLEANILDIRDNKRVIVIGINPRRWAEYASLSVRTLMDHGFTYTPINPLFGIDGQPLESYSGNIWVTLSGRIDGIKVIFFIFAELGSDALAEKELVQFYILVKENFGLDLFAKMMVTALSNLPAH